MAESRRIGKFSRALAAGIAFILVAVAVPVIADDVRASADELPPEPRYADEVLIDGPVVYRRLGESTRWR